MTKRKNIKTGLGITDVIQALNDELRLSASKRSPDWSPLFEISEATVELQIKISTSSGVKGGINVQVVSIGANLAETSEDTHKITLKLTPLKNEAKLNGQPHKIGRSGLTADPLVGGSSPRKRTR